jgi:Fe2+ transport system protein FeoA
MYVEVKCNGRESPLVDILQVELNTTSVLLRKGYI